MSKRTILVLSFLGLLATNMSFGLIGCVQKESQRKAEYPPELELDQRDDPYPDEYIRDVPGPKKKEHKRERAGQH